MFNKKLKEQITTLESKLNTQDERLGALKDSLRVTATESKDALLEMGETIGKQNASLLDLMAKNKVDAGSDLANLESRIAANNDLVNGALQTLSESIKKTNTLLEETSAQEKKTRENFSISIHQALSEHKAEIDKQIRETKSFCDDSLRHNFTITEAIGKSNSIEIAKLNKEQEIISKQIEESDNRMKLYIDAQSALIKESMERISSRLSDISAELSQKTGGITADIYAIKDQVSTLKSECQRIENKTEIANREIPGLRDALKKNSSDVAKLQAEKETLEARVELLKQSVSIEISNFIDKKICEYQKWVNQEYYDVVAKIISVIANDRNNAELKAIQGQLEQKTLEEKWRKEKERQGNAIVNKGVAIIEKREILHNEIIEREKRGENVDKLKERLKAFQEIVEMIK